jgi:hypothetical protein
VPSLPLATSEMTAAGKLIEENNSNDAIFAPVKVLRTE